MDFITWYFTIGIILVGVDVTRKPKEIEWYEAMMVIPVWPLLFFVKHLK